MRTMLAAKIHGATVTEANLDYEGSITLDPALMEATGLIPYEQVHVLDITNGARLETYVIRGREGSGEVCINGAAAHLVDEGDRVIVLAYRHLEEADARDFAPRIVYLDADNAIARRARGEGVRQRDGEPVRQRDGEPVRQRDGEPVRQRDGEPVRQRDGEPVRAR